MVTGCCFGTSPGDAPAGDCIYPKDDGWLNICVGALRRPVSANSNWLATGDVKTQDWLGAGNQIGFNFGAGKFGCDYINPIPTDPVVRVTRNTAIAGGGDSANLLNAAGKFVDVKIPTYVTGRNPPNNALDSNVEVYSDGFWWSFTHFERQTATTGRALACFKYNPFTAKGWGSPRTSGTAASISRVATSIRPHEVRGAGVINHVIHVAVRYANAAGLKAILGKTARWPAVSTDSTVAPNDGRFEYGSLLSIPPFEKGGPSKSSLGLTSFGGKLYDAFLGYGVLITDKGELTAKGRCGLSGGGAGAVWTTAEANELNAQFLKLYDHLRLIDNNVEGTTYSGGNALPLASYCAPDR